MLGALFAFLSFRSFVRLLHSIFVHVKLSWKIVRLSCGRRARACFFSSALSFAISFEANQDSFVRISFWVVSIESIFVELKYVRKQSLRHDIKQISLLNSLNFIIDTTKIESYHKEVFRAHNLSYSSFVQIAARLRRTHHNSFFSSLCSCCTSFRCLLFYSFLCKFTVKRTMSAMQMAEREREENQKKTHVLQFVHLVQNTHTVHPAAWLLMQSRHNTLNAIFIVT